LERSILLLLSQHPSVHPFIPIKLHSIPILRFYKTKRAKPTNKAHTAPIGETLLLALPPPPATEALGWPAETVVLALPIGTTMTSPAMLVDVAVAEPMLNPPEPNAYGVPSIVIVAPPWVIVVPGTMTMTEG
jgi:hypothetical protein